MLAEAGTKNVDYRHVHLDHPPSEPEKKHYEPVPGYVAVADAFPDRGLDFVVVDGHYRTHCVRHALRKLSNGGFTLSWRGRPQERQHVAVPSKNLLAHSSVLAHRRDSAASTNGIKRCVIWQAD